MDLANRMKSFNPNESLNAVLQDVKNEQFIAAQVRDRLTEKGEDAYGKKLKTYKAKGGNVYSDMTMRMKQIAGLPATKVTLRDSGDFHKSFELKLQKDLFNIEGDSVKDDGMIEDNIGPLDKILTLSQQEKNNVVNEIRPQYIQQVRKVIKV